MTSRFDVYLNGISLLSVAPLATVVDIVYTPANPTNETVDRALGDGVFITRRRYQGAKVEAIVDLSIYNAVDRQEAAEALAEWAYPGGVLKTSDRPGRQLHVRSEKIPSVGSALRWTESISISFTADENPYWESITATTKTFTSSSTMYLDGYAGDAKVSATITPSGTMTTFTITCGSTAIKVSGISTSGAVTIDYDAYGFLRIRSGNTSLLDKVVAVSSSKLSSDELLLPSGKTTSVAISSNVSVSCTITAKGVWL